MKLFLDDERFPPNEPGWIVSRQFGDFCMQLFAYSHAIEVISFDHDLGGMTDDENREMNGLYCAKWMINGIMDGKLTLPRLSEIRIHSMDPVGRVNILDFLQAAQKESILSDKIRRGWKLSLREPH
jgi:hypothetical protein